MHTLFWIFHSKRPLTTIELLDVIDVQPGSTTKVIERRYDVEYIVSVCRGLVAVDERSDNIELVHYTAHGIFVDLLYDWDETLEEHMALACLTYLSFDIFKSGRCQTRWAFGHRLVDYPFFDYAAKFWSAHVRPVQQLDSVSALALAFLKNDALVDAVAEAAHIVKGKMPGEEFPTRLNGLHLAAKCNLIHLTRRLLQSTSQFDINQMDGNGQTALTYAIDNYHEQMAELLRDFGADGLSKEATGIPLERASPTPDSSLPTIKFTQYISMKSTNPPFVFAPISRTLPSQSAIICVGRYNSKEEDVDVMTGNIDELATSTQSSTRVSFKSKCVSRQHCELWYHSGQWLIRDVGSTSGTFLNYIRLSQPSQRSKPFIVSDGDIIQLGIDFRGGEESIFRCVKIRLECHREWQKDPNDVNEVVHQEAQAPHQSEMGSPLDGGTPAKAEDDESGSVLHEAVYNGQEEIVQQLLGNGADVSVNFEHLLITASRLGHEQIVKSLLEAGLGINVKSSAFDRALQEAAGAEGDQMAVAKLLLEAGANVNFRHGTSYNALQAASYWGNEQVVKLLLDAGADVDASNALLGIHSALQVASEFGHGHVVRLLLAAGADVNASNAKLGVCSALHQASESGHGHVVKLLLDAGADVNASNAKLGIRSALHQASESGHGQVVKLLLAAGADVNFKTGKEGQPSALQLASESGHERNVTVLLDAGAEINFRGGEECRASALQAASQRGHEQVVRLLLDAGADVNVGSAYSNTAIEIALGHGHEQVVKLLLARGALPPETPLKQDEA